MTGVYIHSLLVASFLLILCFGYAFGFLSGFRKGFVAGRSDILGRLAKAAGKPVEAVEPPPVAIDRSR